MAEERERDLEYLQKILEAEREEKDKENRRKVSFYWCYFNKLIIYFYEGTTTRRGTCIQTTDNGTND